jgi:hypothetical protein
VNTNSGRWFSSIVIKWGKKSAWIMIVDMQHVNVNPTPTPHGKKENYIFKNPYS